MKKLLVVLLAAALCISMLAGCAKTEEAAEETTTEAEATETEEVEEEAEEVETETEESEPAADVEIKDFTCLGADCFTLYFSSADEMEEFYCWQALREIMEARGVNLVMEWVLSDQYATTLQTRFGAMNEIPYFVSGYGYAETDVQALANNGIVLDINTILPYSDGTVTDFFENDDFGMSMVAKVTTPEGQMYWLPNVYISEFDGRWGVGTNVCVTIRGDWLDQLGLEMPTTIDEFYDDLEAFNTELGGGVAGQCVYSEDPTDLKDGIDQWFGLVYGLLNVDWMANEATSPWLQEGFTEYVTYANKLYAAGLYDPEMLGSTDTLRTKVSNNLVGGFCTYAAATSYEPLIEACKDENGVTNCCYNDIYPITAIEGITPLLALEDPVYMWDEFFFTNQCTDLELAAAFLDAYYCDDHITLINWGVEGKNYEVVNGEKQFLTYTNYDGQEFEATQINQSLTEKADMRLSFGKICYIRGGFPDFTYNRFDNEVYQCRDVLGWAAQKCEYQLQTLDYNYWTSIDVGGTLATASTEQVETYNEYYNDLDTASKEYMSSLVSNGNFSDIEGYVATLKGLGLEELIAIYQERYDRFVG